MADPDWNNGNYYGGRLPGRGLAVARMVGHITYMSDESMREKFGRKLRTPDQFEVESYLKYRGYKFVDRFDANSYIYITRAMDTFDLTQRGALPTLFEANEARFLLISFTSDWLYPPYQSLEIVKALTRGGIATWRTAIWTRATGTIPSWWKWSSRPKWCADSWRARSGRRPQMRKVDA